MQALKADEERILSGARLGTPTEIDFYASNLDPYGQGIYRTYLDSGYYCEQLERYARRFGKEKLFVILYDDFVSQPDEIMKRLFSFLDCAPEIANAISLTRINESAPGMLGHFNETLRSWLLDHYRLHNRHLENFLGRSLSAWELPFESRVLGSNEPDS